MTWTWRLPPSDGEVVQEQLELGLFRGEPWEGRSPRGLTRGHLGVILKPEAAKSTSAIRDPLQVNLFERRLAQGKGVEGRRPEAPCAPTLLPLKPRRV